MRRIPNNWKVIHYGHGRGDTSTRVEMPDGRGVNFSGRLSNRVAIGAMERLLRAWDALDMRDAGLSAFNNTPGE